jgi:glutamate synthase (NADPH/NADH) large chain
MSGGIAYVYDPADVFPAKLNRDMVQLQELDDDDVEFVHRTVQAHLDHTESTVAASLLASWPASLAAFKKVMPTDYSRVLNVMKQAEADGLDEQSTLDRVMEAARG